MSFLSPWTLLALLALLPLALAYRQALASRASAAALHPDASVLEAAGRAGRSWTRHLAAGLYLAAVGLGLVAAARPVAVLPAPVENSGVMLSLDVSGSMRATDVQPSRFEAMKSAARAFVNELPGGMPVGLATFAGYSTLVVPLTAERPPVLEAIDTLFMSRGTAIGEGLLEALRAFPERPAAGTATVVLLSDGRNTTGSEPLEAASEAVRRGVKVHTIGVGSRPAGYNPSLGDNYALGFDEEALKAIAARTGGTYHFVDSAAGLREAYATLSRAVGWRPRPTEVSGAVGALAAALLAASLGVSHIRRRVV